VVAERTVEPERPRGVGPDGFPDCRGGQRTLRLRAELVAALGGRVSPRTAGYLVAVGGVSVGSLGGSPNGLRPASSDGQWGATGWLRQLHPRVRGAVRWNVLRSHRPTVGPRSRRFRHAWIRRLRLRAGVR